MKRTTIIVFLLVWSIPGYAQNHNPELFVEWEKLNAEVVSLHKQGRYDRAVEVAKKAFKIAEEKGGLNHPTVPLSLNNLAELYRLQGRYTLAEPPCKRALAIREKKLGPDHPAVASSLNNLAAIYRKTNRIQTTKIYEKRAAAIRAIKP